MPKQNKVMAKRAYYAAQAVVSDLINDDKCYPDKTSASGSSYRAGFDDGYGYKNCKLWGGEENTGTIESEGDKSVKFKTLFRDKLGLSGNGDTFTTPEGMSWSFSGGTGFSTSSPTSNGLYLVVDVNGSDEPNCSDTALASVTVCADTSIKDFDQFVMRIYTTGKIEIVGDWAEDAVQVNNALVDQ